MSSQAIVSRELGPSAEAIEKVLVGGDLAPLTTEQRISYYNAVCVSLGLNPLTRPFDFIKLNNKLVLYAKRDCTDQLRKIHGVSITDLRKEKVDDIFIVTATAADRSRTDTATGAVNVKGLAGENLANAVMKAETKAKRRVTLSLCGLGLLDEMETGDIPADDPDSPPSIQQPRRNSLPAPAAPVALPVQSGKSSKFISPEQRREFFAACVEAGWSNEQVKGLLLEKYGLDSSAHMPAERYDEICARFRSGQMQDVPEVFAAADEDIPF